MCHMNFFGVLKSDFEAFGSKKSCFRDYSMSLKDTFFPIHFEFQSLKRLKTVIFHHEMSHGGGGQKSVTYYLNGP